MAGVLLLLAFLVRWSPLPEVDGGGQEEEVGGSVLEHPNLVFGVVALFLYVGAEVIAVDTIGPYANTLGIPLSEAKYYGSYTLLGMVLGYILGIFTIPRTIGQSSALALSAATGVLLTLGVVLAGSEAVVRLPFIDPEDWAALNLEVPVSALLLALLGVANALVWPAIWPLAIEGTGRNMRMASALLIMAIAGGAVMPLIYNALAVAWGDREGYLLLLPCYVFIGWYAIMGHRRQRWASRSSSGPVVDK